MNLPVTVTSASCWASTTLALNGLIIGYVFLLKSHSRCHRKARMK